MKWRHWAPSARRQTRSSAVTCFYDLHADMVRGEQLPKRQAHKGRQAERQTDKMTETDRKTVTQTETDKLGVRTINPKLIISLKIDKLPSRNYWIKLSDSK